MDYNCKVILITGASSDIAKSIIENFSKCKAKIIVTYKNNCEKALEYIAYIRKKYEIQIEAIYLDLCKEKSIEHLYNYVKNKYKKLDILINNAAISIDSFIEDKTKMEFMKVLEVNVVGTFLMMKYFDNIIDGYIFNISSTDGIDTGSVYSIDYNASKAGINSITKTFSLYSKNKILSICPNWVDTKSTRCMDKEYLNSELKRINQKKLINPKSIYDVIIDCINKDTKTGSIVRIDGEEND